MNIPPLPELLGAIMQAVFVLIAMMTGSALGEEAASFFFGRIQGKALQLVYMALFLPLFVTGGYVYVFLQMPQTLIGTALFFGLWGVFAVVSARLIIHVIGRILGFRVTLPKKQLVNGKVLVKYLKDHKVEDHEIRKVLVRSCDSENKARRVFEGGSEWVNINADALAYELSKRGFSAYEVIGLLKKYMKMKTEEAAEVWKRSSV